MTTWWELVKALPEIIKLIQAIQAAIVKAQADRKISGDIKTIHEAFTSGDASQLNALFASSK
jgi:hypothetical protein